MKPLTATDVQPLLEPYSSASDDIGFAVGVVNPTNTPASDILFFGQLVNYHGQPLTLDSSTYFELASISKTFCATLFAYYCKSNPSLTDAIVSSFHPTGSPSLSSKFDAMPLLSLANYTSGLPPDAHYVAGAPHTTPKPLPHPYTVADMYSYLSNITWTPGTSGVDYTYSNLGFALLGESLPVAVGASESYGDLVVMNVSQPLGMMSTVMFDEVSADLLPRGYNPLGQPVGPGSPTFPAYYGAGGLVSTPGDMMTYLQFNMAMTTSTTLTPLLPVLQQASTSVETKHGSSLGLGWFLTTIATGSGPTLQTVWKDGGYAGYRSFITWLAVDQPGTVASGAGVFVLTNSAAPTADIARAVLCLLCGYLPPPSSTSDLARSPSE